MAVGALTVSVSAVTISLAGTSPATASMYRCLLALPVVAVLAAVERSRVGGLPRRRCWTAVAAGVLFAGDALWWTQAIFEVGAGLSTVLVNAQIALVPLLAWFVDSEALSRRFVALLPVVLVGVVLTGGVFEQGVAGTDPVLGTAHAVLAAVCYSGFLFLLRRGGHAGQPVQTYGIVLVACAAVSAAVGPWWHGLDLAPGWAAMGWLLSAAAVGQLLGWLLVAAYSSALPSDVGAALLLLTPVGALALGALVLGERPSAGQLAGCVLMLGGAYLATARRGVQ